MALDRLLPISTTPGAVTGNSYMDAVQEEVTGLWDRSIITLTAVAGANTITATATPALTASVTGNMHFILKPAATNTTTVTLNINAAGAIAIVDAEGTALTAGALRINANYLLHYDSGISKFVVVGYIPAASLSPGSKLLRTQVASSSASLDFVTGVSGVVLDDTYDAYELILSNMKPATDDIDAWLRIGTGGGPTYQTTSYQYAISVLPAGGSVSAETSASAGQILMNDLASTGIGVGNASVESFSAKIIFHNPESTSEYCIFDFHVSYLGTSSEIISANGSGCRSVAGAITAVRFMFGSGNIVSGRATLYGLTKA